MCTPALLQLLPGVTTASQCFPPNHLHRCHGLDSVVGSPRKQRGLDEDPHKQCQHLQPIKILFPAQSLDVYLNFLDYKILSPKIASSSTSWKVKSLKYAWPGHQPLKVLNLNAHQMKEPFTKTQMRDHWPGTDTVTKRSQMPAKTKFYQHQFHHRYYIILPLIMSSSNTQPTLDEVEQEYVWR